MRRVLPLLLIPALVHADETPVEKLVGRALASNALMADLQELCDTIGGRPTGSPAFDRAVEWGVAKFKAIGLEVKTEPVPVPQLWLGGSARAGCVAPEAFPIPLAAAPFTLSGTVTARLVDVPDFTKM